MAFGTPGSRQGRGCLTRLGVGSAGCRSHGAKHFPSAAPRVANRVRAIAGDGVGHGYVVPAGSGARRRRAVHGDLQRGDVHLRDRRRGLTPWGYCNEGARVTVTCCQASQQGLAK
jgi:hypothetical protein